MPCVLYLGLRGARNHSLSQLQLFAFMLVLAVTLQLSVILLLVLDDGTLSQALIHGE